MTSLTGLPQSAVILVAAFGFAGLAWTTNAPREPEPRCEHVEVVQYLPLSEIAPIIPPVQGIGWPLAERQRADDSVQSDVKTETVEEQSPAAPTHHRRHWRRWTHR